MQFCQSPAASQWQNWASPASLESSSVPLTLPHTEVFPLLASRVWCVYSVQHPALPASRRCVGIMGMNARAHCQWCDTVPVQDCAETQSSLHPPPEMVSFVVF